MVYSPLMTPLILLGESVLEALRAKHPRAQDLDNALLLQGPIEEVNAIIFDEFDASTIRNAALHIRMVLQVYLALMLLVGVVYAVHSREPLRICVMPYQVLLEGLLLV